jgi:nucleotide-binding universal stress UspA family protein
MSAPASPRPEPSVAPAPGGRLFRQALVALDLAEPTEHLAHLVTDLLTRQGARLIVCHVVMRSTSVAGDELDGEPANAEEIAIVRRLREQLVGWLGESGHQVAVRVLHGDPGQRICEYARHADCDLIVLAARPNKGFADRLRGSVSKYVVVNAADRSVLVLAA